MKIFTLVVIFLITASVFVGVVLFLESGGVGLGDVVKEVGDFLEDEGGGVPETEFGGVLDSGGASDSDGIAGEGVGLDSISFDEEAPSIVEIDQADCGFYFVEYGVCGGLCPSGECVSEGRSCYCRD